MLDISDHPRGTLRNTVSVPVNQLQYLSGDLINNDFLGPVPKGLRSNAVNPGRFTAQFANRNPPFPSRIPKERLRRLSQLALIKVTDCPAHQVIDGNP